MAAISSRAFNLISSDGVIFPVLEPIMRCSKTLSDMLDDIGDGDDNTAVTEIPLLNVDSATLPKILEFFDHLGRSGNTAEDDAAHGAYCVSYAKEPADVLLRLLVVANYLDNAKLIDAIAEGVTAQYIKGKSVEEIRATFGIVNDFTEEEYAQVLKENEWV